MRAAPETAVGVHLPKHRATLGLLVALLLGCVLVPGLEAQETRIITTIAGSGPIGSCCGTFSGDGGPATNGRLSGPSGVALDAAGNLFIADVGNNRIRRVDATTGIITTVAGTGVAGFSGDGGPATSAELNAPFAVAVDAAGDLFIADTANHRIRRVGAATGIITTVAGTGVPGFSGDGGPATIAQLNGPLGVAVDAAGNVFIAERFNNRVRRVDAATGSITTVAGTGVLGSSGNGGPATSAQLFQPSAVEVDAVGNLFIGDTSVRRVDAATGIITTIFASATGPLGLALDAAGNIFVTRDNSVLRIDGTTGTLTPVGGAPGGGFGGDGGPVMNAFLSRPTDVAVDAAGNLFIADTGNHRIRKVPRPGTPIIETYAGTGVQGFSGDGGLAVSAELNFPTGMAMYLGKPTIVDSGNHRIRRVDGFSGLIFTVAGTGIAGFSGDGGPATSAQLFSPEGVALAPFPHLFIADRHNHRIRRVDDFFYIITTVAGTGVAGFSGDGGPATSALLASPTGVALDGASNLFIADRDNHRIRRVDATTGIITTVAGTGIPGFSGDGGPAVSAELNFPTGLAMDRAGNLFIVDANRIRLVDAGSGIITTVAGTGIAGFSGDGGPAINAQLFLPKAVLVDTASNLFIGDTSNHRIRRVDAASGLITTVAGAGAPGFSGDGGPATSAQLNGPWGMAVDSVGNLFVADSGNHRIQRVFSNQLPVADPQSLALAEDTALPITLTGSDPDGNPLTSFTIIAGPANGSLSGAPPDLTYTPNANFNGFDWFLFTVSDPNDTGDPKAISLAVLSVNDPPVANPQSLALTPEVASILTLTGLDVDADTLAFAVSSGPSNGTLSAVSPVSPTSAVVSYTPNPGFRGTDSFSFTANDGTVSSPPATISLLVDRAPVAHAGSASGPVNTDLTPTLSGFDPDGDALNFFISVGPAHGTLSTPQALSGTAARVVYTPPANFVGGDSFTFAVTDGVLTSGPASVSLLVEGNTLVGPNVVVQPVDPATGTAPVTLTFANILEAGVTELTITSNGPTPPLGLGAGNPAVFFDLSTTAQFSGPIQVCIDFSALGLTTTEGLKLYHFENGEGVNRTVSVDLANQIACAEVSFLSPFALFTPLNELFVSNFQTFIPHSAQGGGFLTRLFVTNPSNQPNRLSITRRDPSGTILETTETTLGPGGTVQLAGTEAERVGALGVEWLALGSEYPLAASILFDFDSASLDLAEDFRTAVGALPGPPVSSFTVPVRVATLDVTVSLALANLTDADNQVTLTLRDTTGATRATDSLTLGPFAQAAFSLQDRDAFRNAVLGVPEFVGSLDVAATDPAAPLAALVAANERGQLTSLPVSQSTMDAVSPPPPDPIAGGGPRTFLPHSATGGGFLTRVLLTNLTRSINVVTLHRYEQNGLLGDRRILSLPPQGTVLLADSEAARAGPLGINWFALRSDFEIIASMLFDFDSAALGLAEDFRTAVSALPSLPLLAFTAPVRVAGVEDTVGLALANLSSQSTEVTLKLRDASGTVVAEDSLVLDGLAQTAFVLHDRAAFRDVLLGSGEFLGSLAVTSGQPVAALVVGSSNRQLFALPVTPGAAE